MIKPNNYDATQVSNDYKPIDLGGHHAVILSVKEQKSSTGKDMIVVALDFAKNDAQAGYFKKQFDADTRDEKKWPFQAIQYILTEDMDGKCSRNFKSFITSFEKSNNCETIWGDNFISQFKNKKIGVVYGEVEEEYNGEVKTRRRIRWFCEDAKVEEQSIPNRKNLPTVSVKAGSESFMNVADSDTEEVPF